MSISAAAIQTSTPLRNVFDVTVGIAADSGTVGIPHNISFADIGAASVPNLMTVTLQPMCSLGVAPWAVVSVNSVSVVLSLTSASSAWAGVGGGVNGAQLRVEIQRVHSIQG